MKLLAPSDMDVDRFEKAAKKAGVRLKEQPKMGERRCFKVEFPTAHQYDVFLTALGEGHRRE